MHIKMQHFQLAKQIKPLKTWTLDISADTHTLGIYCISENSKLDGNEN